MAAIEELTVVLDADIRKFDRQMQRTQRSIRRDFAGIEKTAARAGRTGGAGFVKGFDTTATRQMTRTVQHAMVPVQRAEREFASAGRRGGNAFADGFGKTASKQMSNQTRRVVDPALRGAQGRFESSGKKGGLGFTKGIGAGLAGLGAALGPVAAVGVAAGVLFIDGFTDAIGKEQTIALLSARVGAFGAESERLGEVAGSLYVQGYGDSLDQVSEALRGTVQNIEGLGDATNAELEDISRNALVVSQVLGEDVGRTTRAVGKLLKTDLVDSADEAFDLLIAGAQAGGNEAQDLLDTFSEYSTQFRTLGLGGEQAMGLITQGLQAGARDADVVADAIKEFTIEAVQGSDRARGGFESLGLNADQMVSTFAKGGPEAAAAFDGVLDQLRGIEDEATRNAIAVELFGTKAEDMGDALFALDPSEAVAALGDVGGAAERAGNTLEQTFGMRLEQLKRTMKSAVVDFIENKVMPVINGFLDWAKENPKIIGPVITAIKTLGVVLAGLALGAGVIAGLSAVFSLVATPVGAVVAVVAVLAVALKHAWENAETFRGTIIGVLERVKQAWADFWEGNLRPGLDALSAWWGETWPKIQKIAVVAFKTIRDIWLDVWNNGIKPGFQDLLDWVQENWPEIRRQIIDAFQQVKAWWDENGDEVFARMVAAFDEVRAWWDENGPTVTETIRNFFRGVIVMLENAMEWWDDHGDTVIAVVVFTVKAIGTMARIVVGAIKIVVGAIQTMNEAWNTAKETVETVSSGIGDTVQDLSDRLWGNSIIPDMVSGIIAETGKLPAGVGAGFTGMSTEAVKQAAAMNAAAIQQMVSMSQIAVQVFAAMSTRLGADSKSLATVLSETFKRMGTSIVRGFAQTVRGVATAWAGLRQAVAGPVRFLINPVVNKGLRGVWNTVAGKVPGLSKMPAVRGFERGGMVDLRKGGKLSGYSEKDNRLAAVRDGEGVLTPQTTSALGGKAFIDAANRLKSRAGELLLEGFAGGGIVGLADAFRTQGKNDFDGPGGVVAAGNQALNGILAATAARTGRGNDVPGAGYHEVRAANGAIKDTIRKHKDDLEIGKGAKGVVKLAEKSVGRYPEVPNGSNRNAITSWYGMPGAPWCAQFISWLFAKTKNSSALKGASRTAWTGDYYTSGMKRVPGSQRRPADVQVFGTDHVRLATEKGGMGVGGNEGNNVGKGTKSGGALFRPSFARGGMVDPREFVMQDKGWEPAPSEPMAALRDIFSNAQTYDQGGYLPPGYTLAYNNTGSPEPIGAEPIVVEINLKGDDDEMIRRLRKQIKVRGGGNVQVVLGGGGR